MHCCAFRIAKKNDMKKQIVLVTGASGFIGSHICEYLLKKGCIVYGTYLKNKKDIAFLMKQKSFKGVPLDLLDFASVHTFLKKIKPVGVFHAAALHSPYPIDSPFPFFNANGISTLSLLEACRLNGIKKFIHSSSMSVYGTHVDSLPVTEEQPATPYDFYSLSKKIAEDMCYFYGITYKMHVVILRYVGTFGPRRKWGAVNNFIDNALQNKQFNIRTNINWDIISVSDVAKANYRAFLQVKKEGCLICNIGSGKEINIVDLAKKIRKFSQSNSKIDIQYQSNSSPYHFFVDIKKAKKVLQFIPSDVDKGLLDNIRFKQHINDHNNSSA